MTTRRGFLFFTLPSVVLAQTKSPGCEALLDSCMDRESAPFRADATMKLAVEPADFDDVAAYQLAIAELIHDQFSGWISVDPESKAKLKITGGHVSESGFQLVMMEFGWKSYQLAKSEGGDVVGVLEGFFVYRSKGLILSGEKTDRVERVREVTFSLLSDIQKDLAHFKRKK